MLAAGTAAGGRRIVHTVSSRFYRGGLLDALAAQSASAIVILGAVSIGAPVTGMDAFNAWSHPSAQDMADASRAAQHHAYHARRELLAALQAALSTPIDQEDVYTPSERIDRILTEARDTLREAEVLGRASDAHTGVWLNRLAAGTRARGGLSRATHGSRRSGQAGGRGQRCAPRGTRLPRGDGGTAPGRRPAAVFAGQVVYRRYLGVAEAITAVADKLWFVVLRGMTAACLPRRQDGPPF